MALETCLNGARPEVEARVLVDLEATPRGHFAGAVLGLLDYDAPFALGAYPGRKLHIYSGFLETHHLTPIHAQAPGIGSLLLPNGSHWVHLDQPDAFNAVLRQVVAQL